MSEDDDIVNRLTYVGGFSDEAVLCSEARDYIISLRAALREKQDEINRLREKCNMQAMVLQRITPETHPGVYFIHTEIGNKDQNGMPEKLLVVPAYGCDFSYIYERTDRTTGPEW